MARAPVEGLFSRRALAWVVGVSASSLGLAVALTIAGVPDSAEVASFGADAFSRSALGYRGLVALARGDGIPVVVSRHDSGRRAGRSGVLVLAEPQLPDGDPARARRMAQMMGEARTALVVLPKWRGVEDPSRAGWIGEATAVPRPAAGRVLSAAAVSAHVTRHSRAGRERCDGLRTEVTWTQPQLLRPATGDLEPVVTCDGGVLLGVERRRDLRVFVLSDPDVLSNHGLAAGDNALAAREILAIVRGEGMPLVLDEVLHGHERVPALWRELLAFPLLPAAVQASLALLALVLSGLGRFGAPVDAGLALAPGKSVLIENTAVLLRSAGHSSYTLGRYLEAALAETALALHVRPGAGSAALREALQSAARRRRVSVDVRTLEAQVERLRSGPAAPAAVVAAARRVFRFREEVLRGPRHRPGRQGSPPR
jgi:hypothetical protein